VIKIFNDIDISDFFVKTPDLVMIAGRDGYLRNVNNTVVQKLGYSEEELFSRPITDFMHPQDVEITLLNRVKLLNGEVLNNFCNRYLTKQGEVVWLEWTSIYMASNEIVLAIAKDITARKKNEEELHDEFQKFRNLATHFKNKLEKDRKYFAYELHEEIAQLAFVIDMDVTLLNKSVKEMPANVKERLQNTSDICKILIDTIQRLAFSIGPQMLDDCGLCATLEWLCDKFSVSAGIPCRFKTNISDEQELREIKIDYFRICQDILFQMIDQSKVSDVEVSLMRTDAGICLFVHDSSDGISAGIAKQSEGLININERANSIGGIVTIRHNTGDGTGISVSAAKCKLATADALAMQ
jgi:PAS domain S-box-containing protein